MILIKIGGGAEINLEGVVNDLAELSEPYIIIHGANAVRDALAEERGTPKQVVTSVSGYQSVLSDKDAIDNLMMAYAGVQNKRLVEMLQVAGVNAVGLSGIDGRMIQGMRNRGIKAKVGEKVKILRDFSGKPKSINADLLSLLTDNGYSPVLCVPIIDENGYAINSENDDIINVLQQAIQADTIVQLIEAPGFMDDIQDANSLVKTLTQDELEQREQQVEGRMKRKMLALRRLFENGQPTVYISDGRVEHPVSDALSGKGTTIK